VIIILTDNWKIIEQIRNDVNNNIDISKDYSDDEILDLIEEKVMERGREAYISIDLKKKIISLIFNSKRRLDILQPLIDDAAVTEIMINGFANVFAEREGRIYKENTRFENEEKLYNIIQSIVGKVNRMVNEASPIVDARLDDGSRVNIVLPPIALNGPIVTIRKFPENPLTMDKLVELGAISEEASRFLEVLVKARYNIFICGSTGSGKTTVLNALSNFIPVTERIITIEDSAELKITGIENIVRLETRNSNTEGKGEITVRDLIKAALRMRPDRIIVGEVRGAEALDMLQAMNTGHDGSISTGHANSTEDMLSRLETMVLCGAVLPLEAIRQQIASAIDIIIFLSRLRDKSRRMIEISEVADYRNSKIRLNPLFLFEEEETGNKDIVKGRLKWTGNEMLNTAKLKIAGFDVNKIYEIFSIVGKEDKRYTS
jgi:pilus assembly protein CpaF